MHRAFQAKGKYMRFQDRSLKPRNARQVCGTGTLLRVEPTLCTLILRFADTAVTGAGPSNPWSWFARRNG